jgi:hypothetical protein
MLTTTLAIRAVLAVLLSAASLTALLRDPAAAMPLPTSAEAAAPPAEVWNGVQSSARHTAVGNFDLAYAVNDAPVVPARVCR